MVLIREPATIRAIFSILAASALQTYRQTMKPNMAMIAPTAMKANLVVPGLGGSGIGCCTDI